MWVSRSALWSLAVLSTQHLFHTGLCDLPVHCLRHQVAGDWEFTFSAPQTKRSDCGHKHPDAQYQQPPLKLVTSMGPVHTMRASLQDPSTAVSDDGSQTGSWTMIYDEAFEVTLGDKIFVAFSYFDFVQGADGQKTNVSHCDATQVGWYRNMARTEWGCYVGKKVGGGGAAAPATAAIVTARSSADSDSEDADDAPEDQDTSAEAPAAAAPAEPAKEAQSVAKSMSRSRMALNSIASLQSFLGPDPVAASKSLHSGADEDSEDEASDDDASDEASAKPAAAAMVTTDVKQPDSYTPWVPASAGFDHPMKGQWQQSVADALNFLQLGWSAVAYSKFEGKTPRELNRLAGVRHLRLKPQKSGRYSSPVDSPLSLLGVTKVLRGRRGERDTFDWRKRDGQNWLTPVVTQGDCGSCYTISTVHMLTARNRIAKKDPQTTSFSVSFPLYCSEYNQGCDGGYGFLQSRWSEDVGLVPESCAPFSEGGGSCKTTPECSLGDSRFRAVNHHYVGGYYGGSDEASIKKELVAHGPVVMSFEPKEDFMYYKNGVYKSGAQKIHEEWEQVDHAVLLVGFGSEDGQAYWTMQNSWGTDWGEEGYFRMARGIDESGCESIVVAAEVVEESSNAVLDNFISAMA